MKIKALAISSVGSVALLGSALAADLPSRVAAPAPVLPPPIMTWTGFYIGASIGGVASDTKSTTGYNYNVQQINVQNINSEDYNVSLTQITAGGYAGYNYQMGSVVLGVEGDLNARFGRENILFSSGHQLESNWDASIRLRLGYLVTPRALVYATGGIAFANYGVVRGTCASCAPYGSSNPFGSRTGWTVGGGIEYALDSNWHMKLEYLYADYGTKSLSYDAGKGSVSTKIRSNTVRAGLSYRFGGTTAAPVMARY
jgi:outer membrane immunogenic protein